MHDHDLVCRYWQRIDEPGDARQALVHSELEPQLALALLCGDVASLRPST